jgi:hypothetical protein
MAGGRCYEGWAAGDTTSAAGDTSGKSRRPSGYRDSSSSARRRWFFSKTAIRAPGRRTHGIVRNTKKLGRGAHSAGDGLGRVLP